MPLLIKEDEALDGVKVSKWPAFLLKRLNVSVPDGVYADEFIVIIELREFECMGLPALERVILVFGWLKRIDYSFK